MKRKKIGHPIKQIIKRIKIHRKKQQHEKLNIKNLKVKLQVKKQAIFAIKNKKSPFHILNGLKSIKFELKGNESRTVTIRFKPSEAKSFADSLLAWKNGGGQRKVVLLSGKAF